MPIQHRILPDSELHEPKGAAFAISGTTYLSDGAGSGNWQKIPATSLQGIASATLPNQQLVTDGAGGIKLVTGATYGQIFYRVAGSGGTAFNTVSWTSTGLSNILQNGVRLQVQVSGHYIARFGGVFMPTSPGDPLSYEAFLTLDGSNRLGNSSRNAQTAYCEAIVNLLSGQEVWVVVNPGTTITSEGSLSLTYLGA